MKTTFLFITLFTLSALQWSCGLTSQSRRTQDCLENRATLDIGSGSTKILVATVNTCVHKIETILFQDSKSLKVKESLKTNNTIPDSILKQAEQIVIGWKKTNSKYKVKTYQAVATEVFRNAKNGEAFIQRLSATTLIPIKIIDQKEEAKLGFWAAIASSDKSVHEVVVWDIGGGSMQMTSYNLDGSYLYYMGKLASVSFKDYVLREKKSTSKSASPNPIGKPLASKITTYAMKFSQKEVPTEIKKAIANKKVVGIGGVHSKSILKQVHPDDDSQLTFDQENLVSTLTSRATLADKDISGAYPETDITNLALVLGFMQGLNIQKLEVVPADLTSGLLLMSLSTPTHKNETL